ncbi:NLR family CARD domain-containing protein 3-like [Salarias fasciatus]|uniref:NLR family CARD domain-containing protein 3-like n=1 Tax=Salarias fasciatus TaxID=181472 RepID=UPI0011766091|nr:NLR family CARD domain-containing protein 3-like [Salarias fasciatus]
MSDPEEFGIDECSASSSACEKSIDQPPGFGQEPVRSGFTEKRSHVSAETPLPGCTLCQGVLRNPVSAGCGHWFCRECITSHRHEADSAGHLSCPACGKKPRTESGDRGQLSVLDEHKNSLKQKYSCVTEGTDERSRTLFDRIYTELYIIDGPREDVHTHHEVRQLQTASMMRKFNEAPLKHSDIFKASHNQPIELVLTTGIAGIGKTFLVQKFISDWAKGLTNQDIDLVILFPFRELNLIQHEQYSLLTLLGAFHPALQKITAASLSHCKLLFIFDGLDESRLSLDFDSFEVVTDITQKLSISVLLTNLIRGNLLPSALVWITSRPMGATLIPPSYVDRVTELRGFTDAQIDDYFRRRFPEEVSASIIHHIKKFSSLHMMCRIPLFCWITATVLEDMSSTDQREQLLPKTVTDLYSGFLLVQTNKKRLKYVQGPEVGPQELLRADKDVLLKLGQLAYEHLEKRNIVFYQEDLEQVGLDVKEAFLSSGLCAQIFKRESVLFQKSIYSFAHLSIQEFLAAVYMFHCYTTRNTKVLKDFIETRFHHMSLDVFLKKALKKSLQSENGHLDLFVRFLHGLSLESNQRLLGGLLDRADNSPETIQRVLKNLRKMNTSDDNPDRSINIFHCMLEMNDFSIHKEIEQFLKSENSLGKKLSAIHCSALAYMLQMSEEVLDELNLRKYRTSPEGKQRLIPAVRNCRTARLSGCELSDVHCRVVADALSSEPSHLRKLDLSGNYLETSGALLLSNGLENFNCELEALWLAECEITPAGCGFLGSALRTNPSHLKTLDLSGNTLGDTGVEQLRGFLESSDCILESLSLKGCHLSEHSCDILVSALRSNPSRLKYLDLSNNELLDVGVRKLFVFLLDPGFGLETLKLAKCRATHESCFSVAEVLKSSSSHLRDLDLSNNKLTDLGLKLFCSGLKNSHCKLEKLSLKGCELSDASSLVSALKSNPSHLRRLDLRKNDLQDSELSDFVDNLGFKLHTLRIFDADGSPLKLCNHQKMSVDELKGQDLQPPGPDAAQFKGHLGHFSDEPGPSDFQFDDQERGFPSGTHQECETSTDSEDILKGGLTSGDPYDPGQESLQQFKCPEGLTEPRTLEGGGTELWLRSTKVFYSLECPGPGVFPCYQTGLVFVMSQEAVLLYSTVQWDERSLESAGLRAAGPLFSIECSEKAAVRELRLPHVQTQDSPNLDGLVCVHIAEGVLGVIRPLEITDSHVIVRVPHLSFFGLAWVHWKNLWYNRRTVRSQVLLFHRPPKPKAQKKFLTVFLLQSNIPVPEVVAQQENSEYIQAPSNCKLIPEQRYTLQCPEALKIQPRGADFDTEYGPNYHPTFEVWLPASKKEVSLVVRDEKEDVWKHDVALPDALQSEDIFSPCPKKKLHSARAQLIERLSEDNLKQLLDRLLHEGVLNDQESDSVQSRNRSDGVRGLVDMVHRKGNVACSVFIRELCELDRHLSEDLQLA